MKQLLITSSAIAIAAAFRFFTDPEIALGVIYLMFLAAIICWQHTSYKRERAERRLSFYESK